MTQHTVSHESITPCVHSPANIFIRLLWIPSFLTQWAPWCELTTSRPALDSCCSSDVSQLSFLNRNFREHVMCSSVLLLQDNPQILLLQLLSKRMHSPACLHTLSSALPRIALYHSIFLVIAFQSWTSSSSAVSWNCSCTENAASKRLGVGSYFLSARHWTNSLRAEQSRKVGWISNVTCPLPPPSL